MFFNCCVRICLSSSLSSSLFLFSKSSLLLRYDALIAFNAKDIRQYTNKIFLYSNSLTSSPLLNFSLGGSWRRSSWRRRNGKWISSRYVRHVLVCVCVCAIWCAMPSLQYRRDHNYLLPLPFLILHFFSSLIQRVYNLFASINMHAHATCSSFYTHPYSDPPLLFFSSSPFLYTSFSYQITPSSSSSSSILS